MRKRKIFRITPTLFFRLSTLIQAAGYGIITYFVIYRLIAKENALLTYLLNIAAIIAMLVIDGVAHRFAAKKAHDIRKTYADMGAVLRAVFVMGQGFTRTAMYLFYLVALVFSRVEILKPDLMPFDLGDFFVSIEYGVIVLFAFDTLKELLIKDKRWFEDHLGLGSPEE
ncbi:MAG: hypothetical protein FWG34_09125 [Oscillospiraceae bacterium]|jgi:small-conductance mechanosensitive channel|nr:hypothetical protein [Oscillospiraceae bacterium]